MTEPTCPRPTYHGFRDADPDLYEFHAMSGVYVNLHEMECVAVDYRPITRQLIVSFECLTGGSELMPATTATLRFDDAEIIEWRDVDPTPQSTIDEIGTPRVRGQVSWMDASEQPDGTVTFTLFLLDASVHFRAASVTCVASTPRS